MDTGDDDDDRFQVYPTTKKRKKISSNNMSSKKSIRIFEWKIESSIDDDRVEFIYLNLTY